MEGQWSDSVVCRRVCVELCVRFEGEGQDRLGWEPWEWRERERETEIQERFLI